MLQYMASLDVCVGFCMYVRGWSEYNVDAKEGVCLACPCGTGGRT